MKKISAAGIVPPHLQIASDATALTFDLQIDFDLLTSSDLDLR